MEKEIIVSADGSHSVIIPSLGVTYHSSHGAIQESEHVFIRAGLQYFTTGHCMPYTIAIFEMGFGTGLNALLSLAATEKHQQGMYYETIELYPLEPDIYSSLNYCNQLQRPDLQPLFILMHECAWNTIISVTPYFNFIKKQSSLSTFSTTQLFNLIYFDAFAPDIQPELWTTTAFRKLYAIMKTGAVLTTYCSKSIVRKAMTEAGLTVEKI